MIRKDYLIAALEQMARDIIDHEEELNRLDNAIGDGDHGTNMARASRILVMELPEIVDTREDLGAILHQVGMRFVSEIGGSAGPLFGTLFLRAGMANRGNDTMDKAGLVMCLEAGAMGVSQIGMSTEGEKTMLDALFPAIRAMQKALEVGKGYKEVLAAGVAGAHEGVEYTKTIQATKGRASYIGERSIGHQDPGATTIEIIIRALYKAALEYIRE